MVSPSMVTHEPVVCPPPRDFGCCFIPSTLSPDLVCEVTLVPLEKAVINYLGVHGNAGPRRILRVCGCTHIFMHRALLSQPEQGCWLRGGGGGGLGADTFLLTITSHTQGPTFQLPDLPPPHHHHHLSVSLGYLYNLLLPPQVLFVQPWCRR